MIENSSLYCTFHLAGRWFGISVLEVKEVTTETRCTRIPHSPGEVHGLVNIRGHIFLALNLANLLAIKDHSIPADAQLILFKPHVGSAFGIVVDQVGDIVSVPAMQTETFSSDERVQLDSRDRAALVSQICKLEDKLLIVLDPKRFLPCIERSIQEMLKT